MAEKNEGENLIDFKKTFIGQDKSEEVNQMLLRIINKTEVNIKSQQRSETDLTIEQKIQILKDIFEQNPDGFLSRFGKWISVDDLRCFCAASGSDMEYAIGVLKTNLKAKCSGVWVKNRRYKALQRLEKHTSYFSDDEMQERRPFLYEQYIGRHMTDEEKFEQNEAKMKDEVKMSSFIFRQIDKDWLKKKEMEEREVEECMEEEEEEDDEEDDRESEGHCKGNEGHCKDSEVHCENQEHDSEGCYNGNEGHCKDSREHCKGSEELCKDGGLCMDSKGYHKDSSDICCKDEVGHEKDTREEMEESETKPSSEKTNLSPEDKLKLREEFLNIMRQRFLDGQDEEFDYSKVDSSDEYDNLEVIGQDEEDRYFDGEEPEIFSNDMDSQGEKMLTDNEDDDYLSDKILEKCCASRKC